MRLETLDMKFLLTVGFSLRTEASQTHPVSSSTHAIHSPLAEKVAAGGRTPVQTSNSLRHLMTEEVFVPPPQPPPAGESGMASFRACAESEESQTICECFHLFRHPTAEQNY